ncbi:transcription factor IIIC subunit delta N-term-domain-containing protein [Crassisporium funariophilum]|nr:transcription factor IIIC subunit delta N-term-domain-containing protein [Crassisporium funariophilum]
MASLPVYAALNIPTVTSQPSVNCLQWSADGQLCFVTKSAAYILTPDHGINFDVNSVVKSTPSKDDPALGWFKTMIQHDKITPIRWPEYSQAWGAVSLGSIDLSLRALAISPSGLSSDGGCIFVTLSSNMDLNLWAAVKNYLKGEWVKVLELTSYFMDSGAADGSQNSTPATLQAQNTSITWTPQVDFGISPTPCLDGSLLILGNRAGCLTFIRYRKDDSPEMVRSLSVADKWITHLAFSSWTLVQPGECKGYLAYGTSDGTVGLVKISQALQEDTENFSFVQQYDIKMDLEHVSGMVHAPRTSMGNTALRWVNVPDRNPILVSTSPGIVKLWSSPDTRSDSPFWTGHRSLRLKTQKISTDSSAFHCVSGLSYVPKHDALVVTLFDGSFHVICALSRDPVWASSAGDDKENVLTSEHLSGVSRSMFVKAEKGNVDRGDMGRINGAVSYDDSACFAWVYESARPSDFSYKHDAKHNSMLVVAQMWPENDDDAILQNLTSLLRTVRSSSGLASLHMLRPFLLHLRDPVKLESLRDRFLNILRSRRDEDSSVDIRLAPWEGDVTVDVRRKFRNGLATNLFGWDDLLGLRMRLSLADFAWKLASNDQQQMECGLVAQSLLNTISHRLLRTIIRHLVSVVKTLSPNESPFVSRMVVQSQLPGSPAELSDEGGKLAFLVQPLMKAQAEPGPGGGHTVSLNEICPACGVEVPLQDITTAVCSNGHTWARCSVTTFILSTPWVRTCVGCSRKAFLPPSGGKVLPAIAQGWVVEELLEAVHRCLFCNNSFVRIL